MKGNKLLEYINRLNAKGQAMMDADPNLWVGMLTTDLDHWAGYGICLLYTSPSPRD